jgi:alpha-tubulin suppressor-like RCC1 family protein
MSNRWKGGFIQAYFDPLTPGAGSNAIYSWGANSNGQVGVEDTVNYSSPVQIGPLSSWDKVSGGEEHVVSTKTDGSLWSWGRGNNYGQLGHNNLISQSSPVQVGVLNTWDYVDSGYAFTAAIKTDGTLWIWGSNQFGQLGLNNTTNVSSPVQVGALTTWSKVTCGYFHTLALKTDGTLWSWGNSANGQGGLNTTANSSSPVQVGALSSWTDIVASYISSYGIRSGNLFSWGHNGYGQLGLNNTTYKSSPTQVGALTSWTRLVTSAGYATGAIKTDGTLWTWGRGDDGQLGNGLAENKSSPVQIGSDTDWAKGAMMYQTTFATKTTGTLWSWGNDDSGRLGQNTSGSPRPSSPVQVGSETSWVNIGAGFNTVAATREL